MGIGDHNKARGGGKRLFEHRSMGRLIPLVLMVMLVLVGWTAAVPPNAQNLLDSSMLQDDTPPGIPIELEVQHNSTATRCDKMPFKFKAHNAARLRIVAQSAQLYNGGGAINMTWEMMVDGFTFARAGSITPATELTIWAAIFDPGTKTGNITVQVKVGEEVIAEHKTSATFVVTECKKVTIANYSGRYADGFWTWTETGVMTSTELITPPAGGASPILDTQGPAPPTLSFTGQGQMTFVALAGGGNCTLTPPAIGSSTVNISGDLDQESETLKLNYDFMPGTATGNTTITCVGVTTDVQPPMDFDPNIFGLGELDFALPVGTNSKTVSQGLTGRAGRGTIMITVVPAEGSTAARQPAARTAAEIWWPLMMALNQRGG